MVNRSAARRIQWRRLGLGLAIAFAVAFGVGLVLVMPAFTRYRARTMAIEARTGVRALCRGVADYHRETSVWLVAGPAPAVVPRGEPVPFPLAPDFERLSFSPGKVRYQYEVVLEGTGDGARVRCIARGDLNSDGRTSLYEARLEDSGAVGPLQVHDELE